MLNPLEPLRPWQKVPAWVCSECGQPATGWTGGPGIILFYCHEHDGMPQEILMDLFDVASGYDRFRMPWDQWAVSLVYRPYAKMKRLLNPKMRQEEERSHRILAEAFASDEPPRGLTSRVTDLIMYGRG